MSATFQLAQMDAIDWLRTLPGASADLGVTDPAYESLEKHRKKGITTRLKQSKASSNPWFPTFPNARYEDLFSEFYRVLRPARHLYVMADPETSFVIKPIADRAGFKFWNAIVWDKGRMGMGYHYRRQHEFILFFEKRQGGKGRRLHDLGVSDIIKVPMIRGGYPTEKPVELAELLIRQSTNPGEVVIDPFMGSGSVGVAATRLGRHFWGSDLSGPAYELAKARLATCTSVLATACTSGGADA